MHWAPQMEPEGIPREDEAELEVAEHREVVLEHTRVRMGWTAVPEADNKMYAAVRRTPVRGVRCVIGVQSHLHLAGEAVVVRSHDVHRPRIRQMQFA